MMERNWLQGAMAQVGGLETKVVCGNGIEPSPSGGQPDRRLDQVVTTHRPFCGEIPGQMLPAAGYPVYSLRCRAKLAPPTESTRNPDARPPAARSHRQPHRRRRGGG